MKSCRHFRQRIALSMVEGLNDPAIQEHLTHCAACRAYAEEIRAVCADHTHRAAQLPQYDAPLRLHGRIRAELPGDRRRWSWVRPILAGALAALIIGLYLHWRPSPTPTPVVITPSPQPQLTEPSYAVYRNHLSRSAEELDAALSSYAPGATGTSELLTVSSRGAALQ
jgi:predicted anti-sigma-YlaC factor YlaD